MRVFEGKDFMKILFAAPENAWGGFLGLLRAEIPEHQCEATGGFKVDTLKGVVGLGGIGGQALIKLLKPFGARMIGIKRDDRETAKNELGLEWVGGLKIRQSPTHKNR